MLKYSVSEQIFLVSGYSRRKAKMNYILNTLHAKILFKNNKVKNYGVLGILIFTIALGSLVTLTSAQTTSGITPVLPTDLRLSAIAGAYGYADVAFDGNRYLVVWNDAGKTNLVGQFVDKNGALSGASLSISPGLLGPQVNAPSVAFNGQNYLVVWDNAYDIVGQMITPSGALIGSPFYVGQSIATQVSPDVASGSNGQFLVVWQDNSRSYSYPITFTYDIYGQYVSSSGTPYGGFIRASPANSLKEYNPSVAFDGINYLVAWAQGVTLRDDIYGTRINTAGNILDSQSIAICNVPFLQGSVASPKVSFGGSNYLVTWEDGRRSGSSMDQDIYSARVSTAGIVLDANGIPISTSAGNGSPHGCPSVFDGRNWLITWAGTIPKAVRLDQSGILLDQTGVTLTKAINYNQWYPSVAFDGTNFLTVWTNHETYYSTVYAQLVSIVDSNPPSITITSPSSNQLINVKRPIITGTSFDDSSVVSVHVKIDTGSYSPTSSSPYSWSYTLPSDLAEGTHTLTALATDTTGKTQTAQVTFTIDTATPTTTGVITSGTLGNNDWYKSSTVGVTLTATDANSDIKEITCSIDGNPPTVTTASSVTSTVYGQGTHSLSYYATDEAGNTESPKTLQVKIDSIAPTVTITNPVNDGIYRTTTVPPATITVDDLTATVVETGYSTAVGNHVYTFTATDAAGNIGSSQVTYTVESDVFAITVTQGANGVVSGPSSAEFGSAATFTITPSVGYHIVDVMVDGVSVGAVNSYTISNIQEAHTVSASFAIDVFEITVTQGINGVISGPTLANFGSDATYTITPVLGYHVVDVTVDGVSLGAVATYTVSNIQETHTISASFAIDVFAITVTQGTHGTISPGTTLVNFGSSQSFTIKPDAGYNIVSITVDGGPVAVTSPTGQAISFSNVKGTHSITATFGLLVSGNAHVTLTGSGNIIIITGGNNHINAVGATATTVIKTGAGNNKINLGEGNNIIQSSAAGNDQITTGNGDNVINISGDGNLQITTGNGNDIITITGKGNHVINAGNGNNRITVGNGNNKITTGIGEDVIICGNGNNNIEAGAGNDQITVGNGNNNIAGGAGIDNCKFGKGKNKIINCE